MLRFNLCGLFVFVLALMLCVAVAAWLVPEAIDWQKNRAAVTEKLSTELGRTIKIDGAMKIKILPTPRLELHDITIYRGHKITRRPLLRAERLTLVADFWQLWQGRMTIHELQLNAPVITIDLANMPVLENPKRGSGAAMNIALADITLKQGVLSVFDSARARHDDIALPYLQATAQSLQGPFTLDGKMTVGARDYYISAAVGAATDNGALPILARFTPAQTILGQAHTESSLVLTGAMEGLVGRDHDNGFRLHGDSELVMPQRAAAVRRPFMIRAGLIDVPHWSLVAKAYTPPYKGMQK